MQLVEKILGNVKTEPWLSRLAGADIDVLELTQWDAQKNLLRKETREGKLFAVALERGEALGDGDVLFWDDAGGSAVVCRIALNEVMEIDVRRLMVLPQYETLERSIALGHALGNQHWPAVLEDGYLYVPMAVNRLVMQSVMNTHRFKDVSFRFIPGEEVADILSPEAARRLFGGAGRPADGSHSHAPVNDACQSENASPHGPHEKGHEHDDARYRR